MKSLHGTIYYILLEQPQICSHLLESIFTQIILCIFSQKFANFEAFKVSTYLFIHGEKFFTNLDIIGCYCSVFFDCLETLLYHQVIRCRCGISKSSWRDHNYFFYLGQLSFLHSQLDSGCMHEQRFSSKHLLTIACICLELVLFTLSLMQVTVKLSIASASDFERDCLPSFLI